MSTKRYYNIWRMSERDSRSQIVIAFNPKFLGIKFSCWGIKWIMGWTQVWKLEWCCKLFLLYVIQDKQRTDEFFNEVISECFRVPWESFVKCCVFILSSETKSSCLLSKSKINKLLKPPNSKIDNINNKPSNQATKNQTNQPTESKTKEDESSLFLK